MVLIEGGQGAIASYPYEDIESGFGMVKYYLYSSEDASGKDYVIGKEQNYSVDRKLDVGTYNFYTGIFNRPKVLEGTTISNFCHKIFAYAERTTNINLTFYHYDGSTSTQIGDVWNSQDFTNGGNDQETFYVNAFHNLPRTKFRVGDQLRVELEFTTSGSGVLYQIGIDPMNRDAGGNGINPSTDPTAFTTFTLQIPFRINE